MDNENIKPFKFDDLNNVQKLKKDSIKRNKNMSEILENTPENFENLTKQLNDYKDKYLRVVAESQNFKNRTEKEKNTALKFANEKFAKDLLSTLDNFENALKVEMPNELKVGIELIYHDLVATLKRHNVFECQVESYDPNIHEVVSVEPAEQNDFNKIVKVLRRGYLYNDRLLRPACVVLKR